MFAARRGSGQAAESGGGCARGIREKCRAGISTSGRLAGLYGVAGKIGQAGAERFERGESYAAADFCVGGCSAGFRGRKWGWCGAGALAFEWRWTTAGGESFRRAGFSERASATDYETGERDGRAGTGAKVGA